MKALVKTQKGDGFFEIMDRPIPEIAEDEVLIKVAFTGICGTDIHVYHDEFPYWPPVIIGHEFSGTVVKCGSKVTGYKEGDKVVGEPHNLHCGKCYLCRTGNIQLCQDKRSIGWGIDGSYAEYVKMPEKLLHKVPENVSMEEAAMMEPSAIVAHQLLERCRIVPNETVVVMGLGAIGLIAARMARIAGAGRIILAGCTSDEGCRLTAAKKIDCFDEFVNVQTQDLGEYIKSTTNGIGADLVIECSGAAPAIANGFNILKKKGRFCAIGMNGKPTVAIPWDDAMRKGIDLQFNMSSSYMGWEMALGLMASGKLDVKPLISEILPLEQWEKAFEDLRTGAAIKVLLTAESK